MTGAVRLLAHAAMYEFRKQTVFRTGFLVREIMRGMNRPLVMIFVYLAMMRASGSDRIGGFSFHELVAYLILVGTFHKLVIHERALDLSQQIFEGYITKFLVMPLRYFTLVLGRFVQFTLMQLLVAAAFYAAGLFLFPEYWPVPASVRAALQAGLLVLMGSYCFLLLFTIIHTLAFWLDVVWTLLVMCRFLSDFISGTLIPVSMMPPGFRAVFRFLFPYWTLSAPIEIFMGRAAAPSFAHGVVVLGLSIAALELLRRQTWRRGVQRYSGAGM